MSKNIVLLSDGTGNSSSKLFKTNVWRMFQALNLSDPAKQVAYTTDALGVISLVPSLDNLIAQKVTGQVSHFSNYAIAW